MGELQALPDRPAEDKLAEMRRLLRSLPTQVDQEILSRALSDRMQRKGILGGYDPSKESDYVWLQIDASGHHCLSLADNLDRALAPWVLGRASLEASARAAWLLDSQLTEDERTKRAIALTLEELHAFGKKEYGEVLSKAPKGLADLDPDSLRKGVPRYTKMVELALGMGEFYGQFSAFVHSRSFAVKRAAIRARLARSAESVDDPRVDTLVPLVIWAYGVAVWRFFQTRDLHCIELEAALAEAGEVVGLPSRFWETRPDPGFAPPP